MHYFIAESSLFVNILLSYNGFLIRRHGSRPAWTEEEIETLKQFYPRADRLDVLKALPRRNWEAIVQQAIILKCRRSSWKNTSGIPESLCNLDAVLMNQLGLMQGQEEVDWNVCLTDWRTEEEEVPTHEAFGIQFVTVPISQKVNSSLH